MAEDRQQDQAVAELEAALESDDPAEMNYHVRQALQLVELDVESGQDADPRQDADPGQNAESEPDEGSAQRESGEERAESRS